MSNINECLVDLAKAGLPMHKLLLLFRLFHRSLNELHYPALQQQQQDSHSVLLPQHVESSYTVLELPVVVVLHRDPGRYEHFLARALAHLNIYGGALSQRARERVVWIFGRSMYETDRIPADWVANCNDLVDEILVPSAFNVETFASSGVDRAKLTILHEPIDRYAYDPNTVVPLVLSDFLEHSGVCAYDPCRNRVQRSTLPCVDDSCTTPETAADQRHHCYQQCRCETSSTTVASATACDDGSDTPSSQHNAKQLECFAFLSVMKWEERKGWQHLVRSFLREFSAADRVLLIMRTSIDRHNTEALQLLIDSLSLSHTLAPIVLLPETLPFTHLPALFASADAVVLASHGEGWGLPLAQSMAMAKPTIATNWSGNTEFMNSQNSFIVPIKVYSNCMQ
jgi:glycosyltransferase involved in cell wall biosynthesis